MGSREVCRTGIRDGCALAATHGLASYAAVIGLCVARSASEQALASSSTQSPAPIASTAPAAQVITTWPTQRIGDRLSINGIRVSSTPGSYKEARLATASSAKRHKGATSSEAISSTQAAGALSPANAKLNAIHLDTLSLCETSPWNSGEGSGYRRVRRLNLPALQKAWNLDLLGGMAAIKNWERANEITN